jgi:hypothetical protein
MKLMEEFAHLVREMHVRTGTVPTSIVVTVPAALYDSCVLPEYMDRLHAPRAVTLAELRAIASPLDGCTVFKRADK